MAGLRNFIIFCLFFLNLKYVKPDSFTAEFVFDALSRRLDSVMQEVNVVKSDIKDIKLEINDIGQKIENIEEKVSNVSKITEKKGEGLSNSVTSENFERQAKSLHRMLAAEKAKLRKTTDRVRNTFSEFELNFRSQLPITNISLVNSIENLRQTLTDHQNETDATLLTIRNKTDDRLNEINNAVLKMSKDSLKKIHEVEETISDKVKADLESVKHEFSSRLHSEITAKLTVLKKKHDKAGAKIPVVQMTASNKGTINGDIVWETRPDINTMDVDIINKFTQISVPKRGYYYIYSRVFYEEDPGTMFVIGHSVMKRNKSGSRPIDRVEQRCFPSKSRHVRHMNHIGSVQYLSKNDKLYVQLIHPKFYDYRNTMFGMFWVA